MLIACFLPELLPRCGVERTVRALAKALPLSEGHWDGNFIATARG
jgi:hypothetical protein